MRTRHFMIVLVLLVLALPASPAQAGGVVSACNETALKAALADGGTVTFSCSGTITLTSTLGIAADTTIDGSGQNVVISGGGAVGVFVVNPGVTLNLNKLIVADGKADFGGGINNSGALTVSNSTISGNSAGFEGGGISNSGTVTVSNSTFSGNSASVGNGGGIDSGPGTVTVSNSTFSGNSAGDEGGGIFNSYGTVTVSNSTFSGNSAPERGGGIGNIYLGSVTVSNSTFSGNSADLGGGIFNDNGIATLKNTIVGNSPGGNCSSDSGLLIDGGGNLSYGDATCPGINSDPKLGPLQDNGGPTQTMALGAGSAARDAADDAICAAPPVNNLDQRGVARPQGAHCDIGAYEAKPTVYLPLIKR
jgi:hypothetical protein